MKRNIPKPVWFSIPIVLFLLGSVFVAPFKIDDTFITLRYAQNLANGNGPVFNPGERVEGYTNFLLVLLETLLIKLGARELVYIKIFLVVCAVVTILAVERFAWSRHRSVFASVIAGVGVATSAPFILWTVAGLETTLFILLVTLGVLLEIARLDEGLPARWGFVIGIVFFLVVLTRPDGFVIFGGVVIFELVRAVRRRTLFGVISNLGAFLVPGVLYMTWKMHFYGRIFPSSFYRKVPQADFLFSLVKGLLKFLTFLALDLNFVILLGVAIGLSTYILNGRKRDKQIGLSFGFVLTTIGLYATYLAFLGFQVAMDDAYRFHAPLIPLMVIALIMSWEQISLLHRKEIVNLIGLVAIAVITVRGFDLWWMWRKDLNFGLYLYCLPGNRIAQGLETGHIRAGLWLKQEADPDDVIVLHDAGAIPYYSELTAIDTWSLMDWNIIQLRQRLNSQCSEEEKQRIYEMMRQYVLNRNPDFIVEDKIGLLSDPSVIDRYVRVGPTFEYVDPLHSKNTRNPFASCQRTTSYVIDIWQRVD